MLRLTAWYESLCVLPIRPQPCAELGVCHRLCHCDRLGPDAGQPAAGGLGAVAGDLAAGGHGAGDCDRAGIQPRRALKSGSSSAQNGILDPDN